MSAVVRPRVLSPHSGEALFLDDALEPLWAARRTGAVCLAGRPGAGKSTALAWLAGRLPAGAMTAILDGPRPDQVAELAETMLVVYAAEKPFDFPHAATYSLASWGEDEVLEYLLACAKERCGSVVDRLRGVASDERPAWPEMWRACLDVMIADEKVRTPREALQRALEQELDPQARATARRGCLEKAAAGALRQGSEGSGLLRYPAVRRLLAGEQLAEDLETGRFLEKLEAPFEREIVREAGRACAGRPAALKRLRWIATGGKGTPLAASILVAAGIGWRPESGLGWNLQQAFLEGVDWRELQLKGARLDEADLARANLQGAVLDGARLLRASLRETDLGLASLAGAVLRDADLACARLQEAVGPGADFSASNLRGACAVDARLGGAVFLGAALEGATFGGANLRDADFRRATAGDVDFTCANLSGADLSGLDLRRAKLGGSKLARADLSLCRLEGVTLHEADLEGACLEAAYLSGTSMPRADLRKASLRGSALAGARWPGADLREADLSGCSFRPGISKGWKAAEELRGADWRGADLRGARLDDTEFAGVDLRGAKIDPERRPWLRESGATLDD